MAEQHRNLFAQGVIAIALVGAAQMLFVAPAREAAEEARSGIAAIRADSGPDRDPTGLVTQIEQRERAAHEGIAELELGNAHAAPSKLVDLLQRLGEGSGVVINRVDPKPMDPRSGFRENDRRTRFMPTSGVVVTVEATGSYREVATFVAALEGRPGFVRTEQINLRPSLTPGNDEVGVVIRTAQLAFDPVAFAPTDPTEGVTQ